MYAILYEGLEYLRLLVSGWGGGGALDLVP